MTKWEEKGAAAKQSGRYRSMEQAWYAAEGKPKISKRDKQMGVTFSGKMVEAQQAFFHGYHYAPAKNGRFSIRTYKKGRLSGFEAATGRAVKWFKGRAKKTKAARKAKRNPDGVTVYQDLDPLGKREWFAYVAARGHVYANLGPFRTKAAALKAGKRVERTESRKNPARTLPVGKLVTVRAMRRSDGKIDLYR